MFSRKTTIASFLVIFAALAVNCSPYMMKAKMAQKDRRYDLAIDYGVKHLRKHPEDAGALRFLENAAARYFEATKETIAGLERIEEWDEVVKVSSVAYKRLRTLLALSRLSYPTESEITFLKNKMEHSNIKRAEALYIKGKSQLDAGEYKKAIATLAQCQECVAHFKDTDDLIALAKTKLAEAHYQKAVNFYNAGDYSTAIEHLEQVQRYVENYKDTAEYLRKCKEGLANEYYQKGQSFMIRGEYQKAIEEFEKSTALVPNFRNASYQIAKAKEELVRTNYEKGEEYFRAGHYKQALDSFAKVLEYRSDYRDVREKYEEARDRLTVKVAALPFRTSGLSASFGNVVVEQIISKAISQQREFLAFVDRQHLREILKEQALGQTGVIDEKTAAQVGRLTGANTIMTGTITLVSVHEPAVTKTTKKANYYVSYLDSRGIKRKKPVPFYYTCFRKERSVDIQISYQLISVETGQIIESKSMRQHHTDVATWVTCPKERINSLPSEDKKRLYASQEPKSRNTLVAEAIDKLSQKVARAFITTVQTIMPK
ncbi:hypothetical protein DRQ15_08100 [candidate division KSB1 bacterium]|mgnify:CR=1 FL=1|nr:MAG: hypothetical protein DRQ15_08100 [candidate division KSB1 bacterium]